MTALSAGAIRALRNRFGDLAEPILALRASGETVAPFGEKFRVGTGARMTVCTAEQVEALAAKLRVRSKRHKTPTNDAAPDTPRGEDSRHDRSLYTVPAASSPTSSCGIAEGRERVDPQQPLCSRALSSGAVAAPAGFESGPQDFVSSEKHRGAMQPKGCAKAMRADPSMSGSAVASGDAVRDASAMPLDVVAAPYSEGREHAGSAAAAPPAFSRPALCGCGSPRSHFGRCWFRRGYSGPIVNPTRRPPRTHTARLTELEIRNKALECEVDALKSAGVRHERAIADLRERLEQFTSEGR